MNCNQEKNALKWILGKDFFWIEVHLFKREDVVGKYKININVKENGNKNKNKNKRNLAA